MRRKLISILLSIFMLMQICSTMAAAADVEIIESGTCGDNLTWTLTEDGVLTISGEGVLPETPYPENYYTKLVIENGVTAISRMAFSKEGLRSVTIPASVTSIGESAFDDCVELTEIIFEGNAPEIGKNAFGFVGVDEEAFAYYPANNATWTEEVRQNYGGNLIWMAKENEGSEDSSEEETVVSGTCGDNLTWTLKNNILTISGDGAMFDYEFSDEEYFRETPWLEYSADIAQVIIEYGVTNIGAYAFCGFTGMTAIAIPMTVETIEKSAFEGCLALKNVFFDGSAPVITGSSENTSVFDGISADCYYPEWAIESWNEDVKTQYGSNLIWKAVNGAGICGDNLIWTAENIPINPDNPDEGSTCRLNILGSGAMWDFEYWGKPWESTVEAVSEVVLYEGLTHIGANAFYWATPLREVTIPASVTSIGDAAFAYTGISSVRVLGSEPELGTDVFAKYDGDPTTITTYAPWITAQSEQWGTLVYTAVSDTTPPVLEVASPTDGSVLNNLYVTFEVMAEDASGIESIVMSYQKGMETVSVSSAPYEINLMDIGDGPFEITFTATDKAGNTTSKTFHYTVDVYPESPTDLTASSTAEGIRLSWTEPESTGNIESYKIYYVEDNGNLTLLEYINKGTSSWVDTAAVVGNTYTYTITSEAGNQLSGPYAEPVTILYVLPDTTLPVIKDVWPATEDSVTFCHNGTLQIAAEDDVSLDYAAFYCDNILIGTAAFDANGKAALTWDCYDRSGNVTLIYLVYDSAGNCAEKTAEVTIRPYKAPETPENLTAEVGFRSAVLYWDYTGDLQTLRQFNIYDGGEDGMLVTSVKNYQYAIRELEEEASYRVAAVDIYGAQSFSTDPITVTPVLTESVAPEAVLSAKKLTAVAGTAITLSGAASTDNDRIESYAWDFGDGSSGSGMNATHIYTDGNTYTVTLTVTDRSGNTDTASAEVIVYDTLGEDATHAMLKITVMDGYTENTPAVEKATVTVYNGEGFEAVAMTGGMGEAVLVVPKGVHTMTVIKEGFSGKMMEIEVVPGADGTMAQTVYLAASGVDVVGGKLTVEPMTYEEIVEAGIDVSDPANNHVVKQEFTIRYQPKPELAFELPIEQLVNALGDILIDQSSGFGWHTFTPDLYPDRPAIPDKPNIYTPDDWGTPKYDVGVFPVGESAYMVIYGQSHWLKEMFNVELIVFNNSYAEDIYDCVAELQLPEGMSLANLLDRTQTESVYLGTIEHIGDEAGADSSVRQVSWYVRGDIEGDYLLSAAVNGLVGDDPFTSTFKADAPIYVYAGSALHLTVTMPESAYAGKDYSVMFSLGNVSERPIYNLSFALDSAQQFTAQRMSDDSVGDIKKEFSNEDFKDHMTYSLPVLEPGKSFNVLLTTTFAYEHQFVEWAVGMVPGAEVGYAAADVFVTTLDGSTTEIPVTIVRDEVKKDDLFQWIWDETIGALKDNAKDKIIEFVDDKIFQGVPVVERGVECIELVTNVKEYLEDETIEYEPTVTVSDGVQCVPESEVDAYLGMFESYSLRRSTVPGVLVWTDAADAVISEDGKNMTMPSGGKIFVLRLGETLSAPEIDITTYYVDTAGDVQSFTRKLTTEQEYIPGLKEAAHILIDDLTADNFVIPACGETVEAEYKGYLIAENGEILLRASNEVWSVTDAEGNDAAGIHIADGLLIITDDAKAGTYTVRLALDGTDRLKEQTIVLTQDSSSDTLIKTDAEESDCYTDGHLAYWTCSVCGKHYADADGSVEIPDLEAWKAGDGRIAAGHTCGERIDAQAPVHTKTELKGAVAAHYLCTVCGIYFTEDMAETTLDDLTGEAPKHTDGDCNHECNICGAEMGICGDGNLDHTCDYGCGRIYGTHQDLDHDFICDYGCSEPMVPARGDIDQNGTVDTADAEILVKYFAGWPGYEEKLPALIVSDVDMDGILSRADAMLLSRRAAGWTE